jgi:PhnB protein
MPAKTSPTPKGYHTITPYLRVRGAAKALEFYKAAFDAKELFRLDMGRKIGHAEIDIAGSRLMLSEEFPEYNAIGPKTLKGTTIALALYVADADAAMAKAVAAGAKVRMPAQDMFYGDRSGQIEDPFGHVWSIQQRMEEVSAKEMQERLDAEMIKARSTGKMAKVITRKPKTRSAA